MIKAKMSGMSFNWFALNVFLITLLVLGGINYLFMLGWNYTFSYLFGWKEINYWMALFIMLIFLIIFSSMNTQHSVVRK